MDQGGNARPVRKHGPVTSKNTAVERRPACALRYWARTPSLGVLVTKDRRSALRSLSLWENGKSKEDRLKSLNSGVRSVGLVRNIAVRLFFSCINKRAWAV